MIHNNQQAFKAQAQKLKVNDGAVQKLNKPVLKKRFQWNNPSAGNRPPSISNNQDFRQLLVNLPQTTLGSQTRSLKPIDSQSIETINAIREFTDKPASPMSPWERKEGDIFSTIQEQKEEGQQTYDARLELMSEFSQFLQKDQNPKIKIVTEEEVQDQITKRLKSKKFKLLENTTMIDLQYKKKDFVQLEIANITSGLKFHGPKSSSFLFKDFNTNLQSMKHNKSQMGQRNKSLTHLNLSEKRASLSEIEPKVLCRGVFCHEDQSLIKPGYHYDNVQSQFLFLKNKNRNKNQESLSILQQLKKDYYLSQHQVVQKMYASMEGLEHQQSSQDIQKHVSILQQSNLPEIPQIKLGFYKSAMINQYRDEKRKDAEDQWVKSLIVKKNQLSLKNKTKLSKSERRAQSLTNCFEKRTIQYPDSRKWLGNFNELVF
eukprot:403376096